MTIRDESMRMQLSYSSYNRQAIATDNDVLYFLDPNITAIWMRRMFLWRDMAVARWTVSLYPLMNFGSTSIYRCVFLYIMSLYSLSRIVRWLLSTIAHFTFGTLHTWNWMPSFSACPGLICSKHFSPSVRTQLGSLCIGFEYFARTYRNAAVTAVHVFDCSGTICRNLIKTSITVNWYL